MKSAMANIALLAALLGSDVVVASRMQALRKGIAARSLEVQGLPDPKCHTGVISIKSEGEQQVCCPFYCGECSDYPTCMSVRGQNSTFACCKSQVASLECGKGAPANICLKRCSEAVPPCMLDSGEVFHKPDPSMRHALEDCNKAVSDWRAKAAAATDPAVVEELTTPTEETAVAATEPAAVEEMTTPTEETEIEQIDEKTAINMCGMKCRDAGFCNNDPNIGSDQMISCSQACMIRFRGLGQGACESHCDRTGGSGCSKTIGGHNYRFCSARHDLAVCEGQSEASGRWPPSNPEACRFGCKMVL